jgi:hypothetical protein
MDQQLEFLEPPRVEWLGDRPFAFSRLPLDYARELEAVAHRLAPDLLDLEPKEEMLPMAGPFGARFLHYNVFLLDPAFLPLFVALRVTYCALLDEIRAPNRPSFARAWMNIHRQGERIGRHQHKAEYIATFAARAEGSVTTFGPYKRPDDNDVRVANCDGQIIVTLAFANWHETSAWHRDDVDRVTYAFDFTGHWFPNSMQIPFEGAMLNPAAFG